MSYNVEVDEGYSTKSDTVFLDWSASPPTKEGWYWVEGYTRIGLWVVKIVSNGNKFEIYDHEYNSEIKSYMRWLGPIPEPQPPV